MPLEVNDQSYDVTKWVSFAGKQVLFLVIYITVYRNSPLSCKGQVLCVFANSENTCIPIECCELLTSIL
jgi:hypothetical protein